MASVFKRGGKKAKGYYYASWTDHTGKRQSKCTRTTDKATAERIANKYETDAALRRDGVIDPALDAISKESQRSIESHLTDYEAKMKAANRTNQHVERTVGCIRAIVKHAEFSIASDLNADGVSRFANMLRDAGRSARTIQAHLTAAKGFTKWLTEHHKLPRDPLASVKKPNPKADRRRERRMLLPEEWRWLETTTVSGPVCYGMTGEERAMLYATAIQTGLRSTELRSLTRGRLYLEAQPPNVTCKAGLTKNREAARQYILTDLAAQLRKHITTKSPAAPVFKMPHRTEVAQMLRDDLAAARKRWLSEAKGDAQEFARRKESDFLTDVSHDGERVDFHALRHTCGAWLAMAGEHPKVIQTVMRHGSITLTMDTYGHLFPGQEANAVGRMQGMLDGPPEALRATGTDHATAEAPEIAQRLAQRADRDLGLSGATACDDDSDGNVPSSTNHESPKPLKIAKLGDEVRSNAIQNESSRNGGRTRTARKGHRILSPVRLPIPPSGQAGLFFELSRTPDKSLAAWLVSISSPLSELKPPNSSGLDTGGRFERHLLATLTK